MREGAAVLADVEFEARAGGGGGGARGIARRRDSLAYLIPSEILLETSFYLVATVTSKYLFGRSDWPGLCHFRCLFGH